VGHGLKNQEAAGKDSGKEISAFGRLAVTGKRISWLLRASFLLAATSLPTVVFAGIFLYPGHMLSDTMFLSVIIYVVAMMFPLLVVESLPKGLLNWFYFSIIVLFSPIPLFLLMLLLNSFDLPPEPLNSFFLLHSAGVATAFSLPCIGLLFGVCSLNEIKKSNQPVKSRKWAYVACAANISVFGLIMFFPFMLGAYMYRSVDPPRRESCERNLKQLGCVLGMYASEKAGRLPMVDDIRNNFIFNGNLFPEYLTDPMMIACPSDAEYDPKRNFRLVSAKAHPGFSAGAAHPDCITDMSYCYFGWIITNQEEAKAFFDAYDKMSPEDYDKDIIVAEGRGNGGGNVIHRLRSPDKMPSHLKIDPAKVPVIWDKPSTDILIFSHVPAGSNVLYLDGHVEFIRYEKEPDSAPFPVNTEFAKLLDERPRAPIPDCE
jgi:prepilin-type processing-associated H-X9-DG protein